MSVFYKVSLLALGLSLSACGTLISRPTQEVTVMTPGALESECVIDNGLRYQLRGGQTARIMRSENPLIVECYGSGNRHRRMRISADGNEWAMLNVANGIVPGLAYDHFAKGLYKYPDVVTIDMSGEPPKTHELPSYHNKDAPNPYDQGIENYGATKARLESDRYKAPVVINKVSPVVSSPVSSYNSVTPEPVTGFAPVHQGAVTPAPYAPISRPAIPTGSTAEELTRSANPDVFDK